MKPGVWIVLLCSVAFAQDQPPVFDSVDVHEQQR
jgi:hypothetical protein